MTYMEKINTLEELNYKRLREIKARQIQIKDVQERNRVYLNGLETIFNDLATVGLVSSTPDDPKSKAVCMECKQPGCQASSYARQIEGLAKEEPMPLDKIERAAEGLIEAERRCYEKPEKLERVKTRKELSPVILNSLAVVATLVTVAAIYVMSHLII